MGLGDCEEVEESPKVTPSSSRGTQMLSSAFTSSSIFGQEHLIMDVPRDVSKKSEFYQEAREFAQLNLNGYGLSDEEFVAKFVLAEQICRWDFF